MLAALPDSGLCHGDKSANNLSGVRAAASLYGSLMSYPQYHETRELAFEEALSRGLICDWPHPRSLTMKWNSWPQTKVKAGVMTAEEAEAGGARHRYSDRDLESYLLRALQDRGLGLSHAEYDKAWRHDHKAYRKRHGLRPRVPRAALVAERLGDGDFDAAVDAILAANPGVRDELEQRLFGDGSTEPRLQLVA